MQVVEESPNPNYLDLWYMMPMHLSALADLVKVFFYRLMRKKDFDEGYISLLYRGFGLVLPGIAFHSPRDYHNGSKMGKIKSKLLRLHNGSF